MYFYNKYNKGEESVGKELCKSYKFKHLRKHDGAIIIIIDIVFIIKKMLHC